MTMLCPAFAETKEENLSDEFFNAAMQINVPSDETSSGLAVNAGNVAEQNMAAEQVGEETMNAGTNVLLSIKDWLEKTTDKLQDFGNSIGNQIGNHTDSNPVITKLLVALVLVAVSVVIIVVMVLIAKKFIFKKQNVRQFASDEEDEYDEYDEYDEDDDEYEEYEDGEDDQEYDEYGEPITQAQKQPENQPQKQPQRQSQEQKVQNTQNEVSNPQPRSVSAPKTMDEAIKIFLQVTE